MVRGQESGLAVALCLRIWPCALVPERETGIAGCAVRAVALLWACESLCDVDGTVAGDGELLLVAEVAANSREVHESFDSK